jgi:polyphosphate glucokinase
MAEGGADVTGAVLAIDVGATSIKSCLVSGVGELLETARRRPTPYPCSPTRLVGVIARRVSQSDCPRVGVGFPGEFADGRVVRPGNLSRPGGPATEVDHALAQQWSAFPLQEVLCHETGREVRVVNDAALAALGCVTGRGVELVVTLGTGVGLALAHDGVPVRVRDVGAAAFVEGRTYDQTLGERARAEDPTRWFEMVGLALRGFVEEFDATAAHLAGGNARRVDPSRLGPIGCPVEVSGNEAPLHGAARLFA